MPADPKAVRVKNPKLLRRAHDAYQRHGCSYCGRRPASYEEPIHVHHLVPRGRGGGDEWSNLVGLCGSFAGCQAHEHVHRGRWDVKWIDDAWWMVLPGKTPRRLYQVGEE